MPDKPFKALVTGGAGFIGRHVVDYLLNRCDRPAEIVIVDNLSNGSVANIAEFLDEGRRVEFIEGDVADAAMMEKLFRKYEFSIVFHLAACITVQDSIDDPKKVFHADVVGTFNLLEQAREHRSRFVFVSTCMVYDRCSRSTGIAENDPVKPASPYAADKLAAENLVLGHHYAYGLPVVILRPFNTFGPFQKSNGEGGVVAIFCERALRGDDLNIYGDGTQTRDFLYVADCAEFIVRAGFHPSATGRIINAGSGGDISINDLAAKFYGDPARIRHVPHIHPQSEIMKLLCDNRTAAALLDWSPKTCLDDGLRRTSEWIAMRDRRA